MAGAVGLQGPARPTVYANRVTVDINASGGWDIHWEATYLDPDTEQPLGEPFVEGDASLRGPCCELTWDIHFAKYGFTDRHVVQTDWEPY